MPRHPAAESANLACERQPSNIVRGLSRVFSAAATIHPRLSLLNELATRMDSANPVANYVELSRKTGGAWALHNIVFQRDPELLELYKIFGRHQRAQIMQDLAYLKYNEPQKDHGFFVEVGVGDGIHVSNTYFFEMEFGWKGLLVEPNPQFHSSIRENREAKLDVRAASSSDGEDANFLICHELSRLSDMRITDRHKRSGQVACIPTATLTTILNDANAPRFVDFMSIDTEGSELEVIKGIDFSKYRIEFMTVEHNYDVERRQAIRRYLGAVGYRCVSTPASLWDDQFLFGS